MLTDTHCHLDFEAFDSDRDKVIEYCRKEGISYILNPAVSVESSRNTLNISDSYPEVYAAIGVHPNDAHGWNGNVIHHLRQLCQHPKVIAIGEIGLDYYRKYTPHIIQQRALQEQLDLAAELGLPVIIHCREAYSDCLNILSAWIEQVQKSNPNLAKAPGVLHSFSGDQTEAFQALELNFFIGVNGVITFEKAETLRTIIQQIPLKHLLIETDAPFLTPHPFRGKRNQPAYVKWIAEKIALLHRTSIEHIHNQTAANADYLFHWGDEHLA